MKKETSRLHFPRVPLPRQTGGRHKSDKDYNRQKAKQELRKAFREPNE